MFVTTSTQMATSGKSHKASGPSASTRSRGNVESRNSTSTRQTRSTTLKVHTVGKPVLILVYDLDETAAIDLRTVHDPKMTVGEAVDQYTSTVPCATTAVYHLEQQHAVTLSHEGVKKQRLDFTNSLDLMRKGDSIAPSTPLSTIADAEIGCVNIILAVRKLHTCFINKSHV